MRSDLDYFYALPFIKKVEDLQRIKHPKRLMT